MMLEYLLLEEKIRSLTGPVYYMPNPGNWGDALIYWGAMRFFEKIGIKPEFISPTDVAGLIGAPKGSVIFGGGGAWCKNWKGGSIRVRDISKAHRVLVMPSTFEEVPLIFNLDNIYFRRDVSISREVMPNSLFCHDMVFCIGHIKVRSGVGVGYFFRKDKEAGGRVIIPDGNVDISAKGRESTSPYGFFDAISHYDVIHTDRLHVSIACALMGRKCFLYEGSYFKNESVYLASMFERYDCVRFVNTNFIV